MSGWKKINLGDIATFHNGYAFKPSDWSEEGKEIIRIQNLTKGSAQINYFQGEIAEKYKVRKGDLLISWSATLGIYEWNNEDAWLNQHLFKVVFDKEDTDKLFFKFLIGFSLRKMEEQVHGATMKHITKKKFDAFPILFPPLETQKKIASILDAADAYRQKTKALIAKYDELTQSLFLDMFGDPVRNEKGWEKKIFEELVSKECPLTYGIVQPGEDFHNGVTCVRPVDLTAQYIGSTSLKKIDPIISSKFNRTLLKGGELLLSVRGSVGVISIADSSLEGSNVTRGIVPIWFESSISNKLFFYHLYNTLEVQREIKRLAKGATLIQINLKDLRELKLIKPPIDLQNQFAERVQKIEAQKAQAQQSLAKAEDLFNSLLQRAFKGELV